MVKNVRRGDTVVTSGGLVGKVTKVVDDDQIEFEIADGVRVRQMRQMITDVRAKGEPVKDEADGRARRRELLFAPHSPTRRDNSMLYFTRWKALAIILTALVVCLFAVPNFFPRRWCRAGRNGRSATSCSASTCRAARTSCSRSTPTRCARTSSKRCATTSAACCATRASAIPAWSCAAIASKCASREGTDPGDGARPNCANLSQPLGGLLGTSGQRSLDVSDAGGGLIRLTRDRGRHHRAHPPVGRAVDPDHRAPRQRTRHGRAVDPAPGHRPHPGAGAGPAGPDRG